MPHEPQPYESKESNEKHLDYHGFSCPSSSSLGSGKHTREDAKMITEAITEKSRSP